MNRPQAILFDFIIRLSGGVATTSALKASIGIQCVPVGTLLLKPVAYAGCR